MALITPSEVSQIAFVNALDPTLILPEFIASASTKFVVPVVTQSVLDSIDAAPADYTVLVNDYIKPYLAFCIKYMFYNQLLTETQQFPTSDSQREAAILEIVNIMEIKRALLQAYLISDVFTTPQVVSKPIVSGFFIGSKPPTAATDPQTDVTAQLYAASLGAIADADYIFFYHTATSLLQKMSFSGFKELILAAGGITTISGAKQTGIDAGVQGQISITDDYGYFCVTGGPVGIAIWKKFILFQT
jgi:hypothetical protein